MKTCLVCCFKGFFFVRARATDSTNDKKMEKGTIVCALFEQGDVVQKSLGVISCSVDKKKNLDSEIPFGDRF